MMVPDFMKGTPRNLHNNSLTAFTLSETAGTTAADRNSIAMSSKRGASLYSFGKKTKRDDSMYN